MRPDDAYSYERLQSGVTRSWKARVLEQIGFTNLGSAKWDELVRRSLEKGRWPSPIDHLKTVRNDNITIGGRLSGGNRACATL